MSQPPLAAAALLQRAQAEGLLPAEAAVPTQETRPWPVLLLTALGAWLAALPLLGVVGLLLGDVISSGVGPYLVGALMLAAAWVLLRARALPVFVEQLAMPALLTGGGAVSFGLFRDLPPQAASALLCGIALAFGTSIPRAWLRALLGAAAAGLLMLALLPAEFLRLGRWSGGLAWAVTHAVLAVWVLALFAQRRVMGSASGARAAIAIESIATGWLLATLAALAVLSGMSFLVGGAMGGGFAGELAGVAATELTRGARDFTPSPWAAGSAALGLAGAACLAQAWPSLRRPACAGVALLVVMLCGFLPMLGASLLALALSATTQRWRLAAACALAAAWIVGSFYYQLSWPLALKAVVLTIAGAGLGALAWWTHRGAGSRSADAPAAGVRRGSLLIALAGVATLGVANVAIWQKQDLIAHGQPVFVALAPADPRSLMQGDYMRLNFNVPIDLQGRLDALVTLERPQVVARRDASGLATLLRIADAAQTLAADELRIELTPKNGRWIFVTDAWFFREGEADRFALAKFGEFRVAPDGRALLVGLADAQLRHIDE